MKLEKFKNLYVARSEYAEKEIPKSAGFWWHGRDCARRFCRACQVNLGSAWWTHDKVIAARLAKYADPVLRAELEEVQESAKASRAIDAQVEIPAPLGLEYRPFQKAGIAYAMKRRSTLIADEMGLGKTIQALGVVNADSSIRQVLVVCPATLKLNWVAEARKWLVRSFTVVCVEDRKLPRNGDFVVVNYDQLIGKNGLQLLEDLKARKFDLLVADEAHYVKNPKAQRTVAVLGNGEARGLVSTVRKALFLTGTPIMNRPLELWPLVNAIAPETFNSFWAYAKRYCGAYYNGWGWDFSGATNLEELQEKLRSTCMIRRLKKDVLESLPEKTRQVILVSAEGYEDVLGREREAWKTAEESLEECRAEADLAYASGDMEAYKRAVERLRDVASVAFEEISEARHALALKKVKDVIKHIDGILDEGISKVVVFAHHRDVVAEIAGHYKDKAVVLTGETPVEERYEAVKRFQEDPSVNVFVGSIKAAGLGITLTASSHVVFAELDWVPANMTQAEDRCHRIGQRNSVLVQHLVVDGSLDARMAKVLVEKQEISDRALDLEFERNVPVLPVEGKPLPRKFPVASSEEKKAALSGLKLLASVCDGAVVRDGMGFNKYDALIGRRLARLEYLVDGQVVLAKRILAKYHRQLPEDIMNVLFPKKDSMDGKDK